MSRLSVRVLPSPFTQSPVCRCGENLRETTAPCEEGKRADSSLWSSSSSYIRLERWRKVSWKEEGGTSPGHESTCLSTRRTVWFVVFPFWGKRKEWSFPHISFFTSRPLFEWWYPRQFWKFQIFSGLFLSSFLFPLFNSPSKVVLRLPTLFPLLIIIAAFFLYFFDAFSFSPPNFSCSSPSKWRKESKLTTRNTKSTEVKAIRTLRLLSVGSSFVVPFTPPSPLYPST